MASKKYEVPEKGFTRIIIITILAGICIFATHPTTGWIIASVVIASIIITILARWEYTYSVEINADEKQIIVVTRSRTNIVTDCVLFDEVYFTYKMRTDYYGGVKSRYSLKHARSILQIECKRKTLALLVPEQDGWNNDMILSLARELVAAGIKQTIDKYDEKGDTGYFFSLKYL